MWGRYPIENTLEMRIKHLTIWRTTYWFINSVILVAIRSFSSNLGNFISSISSWEIFNIFFIFNNTNHTKNWELASGISAFSTSGGSHIPRKSYKSLLKTWLFWLFLEKNLCIRSHHHLNHYVLEYRQNHWNRLRNFFCLQEK